MQLACVMISGVLVRTSFAQPNLLLQIIAYVYLLLGLVQFTLRQASETENFMVSLERIQNYIDLPHEDRSMESKDNEKTDTNQNSTFRVQDQDQVQVHPSVSQTHSQIFSN
eukprot:CAMPEP_0116892966 /NCGR_PEP_ID=MMETSP0467-20121206/3065_1 /TAXON_ID=283647 /ORGANISM="Mesodinium pulex, Strain SPMC105" /LENGTH=110 /DNA_ID=CAMNT_0004562375 /DNA_START=724 /DNA_END=1056 /DNA_ORIENTATION=+